MPVSTGTLAAHSSTRPQLPNKDIRDRRSLGREIGTATSTVPGGEHAPARLSMNPTHERDRARSMRSRPRPVAKVFAKVMRLSVGTLNPRGRHVVELSHRVAATDRQNGDRMAP